MKKLPRRLHPLLLMLLITIVTTVGLEAGVAQGPGSLPPRRLPPGSPEILGFTATPATVRKGEAAVLRWHVANNVEHLWISRLERTGSLECITGATGELRVTPGRDTIYVLHVFGQNILSSRQISVQVREPSGFCTIQGAINNDKREYRTRVELYAGDSARRAGATPLKTTLVDGNGRYQFTGVLEGTYEVVPRGKYPPPDGRFGSVAPNPRSQPVSCEPNGSHQADFIIRSNEG